VSPAPRLHVEVDGDGPVVLLMHGLGGSARNWGLQVRALRSGHRVVRFDARGHGRSEAPAAPEAYEPEAFVADVGRVLDQVGAERAAVGGLSMGAGIALRFALAHPERVGALVLAAFPGSRDGAGFASVALAFADAIERHGLEAAGAEFVWGDDSRLDSAGRLVRQGFLEHPPHALMWTLRRLIATQPSVEELAPALAGLRIPALVAVGSEDRGSLEPSRKLAAMRPGARLVEIPGAGHVVNLQAPKEFNAALVEFLDTVDRSPSAAL
jgi:pimeloyl-ACP methyl ester carboxylesterase